MSTNFFTNRNGNTLIKELEGTLANNPQIKNLDAVVGFLRASGYFSLRPFLDGINKVRILIGIDVDKYIAHAHQRGELFFGAEEQVKEECLRLLKEDIETSRYTKQVEDGMLHRLRDLGFLHLLRGGSVPIGRVEDIFLHSNDGLRKASGS